MAILVIGLLCLATVQARKTEDELRLQATVQSLMPLAGFSGTVTPVHFDPGFALTVRIKSANPPLAGFRPGDIVTFAIHSPSLLFVENPKKGKTYDFVLHRKIGDGKVTFFDLVVRRPE